MTQHNPKIQKPAALVRAICGSLLIGLPAIPLAASAMPASRLNPCPGIYYEESFNSTSIVPQGCPPNAANRQVDVQGITPNQTLPPAPTSITPSLREVRSNALATVTPRGLSSTQASPRIFDSGQSGSAVLERPER